MWILERFFGRSRRPPGFPPVPALDPRSLDEWLKYVRPKPEELRWRDIAWRSTLWEAALEARSLGKPVLLWAMNGHPLAAT